MTRYQPPASESRTETVDASGILLCGLDLAPGLPDAKRPTCPQCGQRMLVRSEAGQAAWRCRLARCTGMRIIDQAKLQAWQAQGQGLGVTP
jgi:predicted RNA-binding Zn-ribbon protein involved in translation (DUF1610 family)